MKAYERLLKYITVWTTSDENSTTVPTTKRQLDLGNLLAEEMKDVSPELWHETLHRFPNIKVTYVSHEKLKELTKKSRAVVRTGETTSYANVILVSGVTF